jgi:hypothetical protein
MLDVATTAKRWKAVGYRVYLRCLACPPSGDGGYQPGYRLATVATECEKWRCPMSHRQLTSFFADGSVALPLERGQT